MERIVKKIIILLFWVFVFTLLVFNGARYLDADLGWHLRVGEDISKTKDVPRFEYYDYTLEGERWVDHEWALNYFSYVIYNKLGYFSLIVFFAFIALLSFYVLYLSIAKKYKKVIENNFFFKALLLLFILLGVYASLPHLGVRMQEFTFLNLVLLLVIIENFTDKKNIKILFYLPLLFLFWANTHAGFLIGLVVLFFWFFIKLFELASYKYKQLYFLDYNNVISLKNIFYILIILCFSVLATLLNPYGLELYNFLGSYSNDFYLKHIVEWLPLYYLPILYKQIVYAALSSAGIILFTHLVFSESNKENKYKFNLWEASVFLVFLYLSFKSKRHFPLFFAVSLSFIFSLYVILFDFSFRQLKKIINFKILSFFIISALFILIVGQVFKINYTNNPFHSFCESHHCAAVQYIKDNPELQKKRIFNDYGWGGFLVWTLPEMKLFIDGRLPQFEYRGHSMLEEYRGYYNEAILEEKLEKENIELVLIKTSFNKVKLNWFERYFLALNEEVINSNENKLKDFLDDSSQWEKVFANDFSAIYLKL